MSEPLGLPPHVLIATGQGEALAAHMLARIAEAPQDFAARYSLFAALRSCGRHAEADAALDAARTLHALLELKQVGVDLGRVRSDPAYAAGIATQLYAAGHVAVASVAYGAAVEGGSDDTATLLSHALSLQHQGRAEEAVAAFRAVGQRFPTPSVTEFVLPALFTVEDGLRRHAAEARAWAAAHAPSAPPASFVVAAKDAPIRLGYFSPNFTRNQARQFMAPLLDHHDPARFTVFAFANQAEPSADWAPHVQVRTFGNISDREAADLVRRERIDVLVDCWGHAAGSRLGMFALRPAPIQVSWLNYQQTTGVAAMDYVLQSDFANSDDMDGLFTEQVWRMGDACAAFRPDPGPRTSPAPSLTRGHATFGAFINPAKLSDLTVDLWAAILRGAPAARLVLKYQYFVDPVLQMATLARFLARGADPGRIEFRGRSQGAAYHAEFADIDLALDPSPCVGGTTSLEALSRGVPVLTLRGEDFYARLGASVVAPAGFPDLVAESPEAYVATTLALADDPAAMQALRDRVPAGFDAAPYRDEVGMTRQLEAVYAEMFNRWRETAQAA